MKIHAEDTVTITLTITREDAQHLLADFDKSREPSTQGKRLYSTLSRVVKGEQTVDQIMREKFADRPCPIAECGLRRGHVGKCDANLEGRALLLTTTPRETDEMPEEGDQ